MAKIYAQQTVRIGRTVVLNDATVYDAAGLPEMGRVRMQGHDVLVTRQPDGTWATSGPAKGLPNDLPPRRNDPIAARRALTRGHGYTSENEALQAARGWLLDGWAVRLVRAEDGTFTLEAWEA